jgi:general secretion pathway protein D
MLAGLIRDEERTVLSGLPGLSDIPLIGRLFASNHRESQQTDIILTLTPHIVRVLDLRDADLRAFRLGRDAGSLQPVDLPVPGPPRDPGDDAPAAVPAPPTFPQPLEGTLPGVLLPGQPPPKKPGGGGG